MYICVSFIEIRDAPLMSESSRYIGRYVDMFVDSPIGSGSIGVPFFRLITSTGYAIVVLERSLSELYRRIMKGYLHEVLRETGRVTGLVVTRGEAVERLKSKLHNKLGGFDAGFAVFYRVIPGSLRGFSGDVETVNELVGALHGFFRDKGVSDVTVAASVLGEDAGVFLVFHYLEGDTDTVMAAAAELGYYVRRMGFTLRKPIYIGL